MLFPQLGLERGDWAGWGTLGPGAQSTLAGHRKEQTDIEGMKEQIGINK